MDERREPTEEQRTRVNAIVRSSKKREARVAAARYWAPRLIIAVGAMLFFIYKFLPFVTPTAVPPPLVRRAVDPFLAVCGAMKSAGATHCYANKEALVIEVALPMDGENAATSCVGAAKMIRQQFPIVSSAWDLQISSNGADGAVLAKCPLP